MLRNLLIIVFIVLSTQSLVAQKVLLEKKTVDLYSDKMTRGANYRHYYHLYCNLGLSNNHTEGVGCEVLPFRSVNFASGLRYKFRLTNSLAIGYNLQFSLYNYHLKQDSLTKIVPNSAVHEKEKLRFNNVGVEAFFRLNIGKRGNIVGRFVDLGFYVDKTIRVKHIYYEETNQTINPDMAGRVKIVNRKLDYIEDFSYGFRTRIGINRYVVMAGYRISDLFNNKFHNALVNVELPRYYFALESGLHK